MKTRNSRNTSQETKMKEVLNHRTGRNILIKEYSNPDDSGKFGKEYEPVVRAYITPRTKIYYTKNRNKIDHYIKVNGKKVNLEIKSRCGSLVYGLSDEYRNNTLPEDTFELWLTNSDYVIYTLQYTEGDDVGKTSFVVPREAFIDILLNFKSTMVKWNSKADGHAINIQTFYTSKVKESYFTESLSEYPTLEEWLDEIGR